MFRVIPNSLSEAINAKLDEQIRLNPDAEKAEKERDDALAHVPLSSSDLRRGSSPPTLKDET